MSIDRPRQSEFDRGAEDVRPVRGNGVPSPLHGDDSPGASNGIGMMARCRRPITSATMSSSCRYVTTSGPPTWSTRSTRSGSSSTPISEKSTSRMAVGWHSVLTHFGVTITGRQLDVVGPAVLTRPVGVAGRPLERRDRHRAGATPGDRPHTPSHVRRGSSEEQTSLKGAATGPIRPHQSSNG